MKRFFLIVIAAFFVSYKAETQDFKFHSEFEREIINRVIDGTTPDHIQLQLIVDSRVSHEMALQYEDKFNEIIEDIEAKQAGSKSEEKFLSWMFYKVHRKYLRNYTPYSTMGETFENGNYDCLSATSLYALLLTKLGYKPEVIETNYHIYLRVTTEKGLYLFESTDPIYGFESSPTKIEERLASYNQDDTSESQDHYQFKNIIESEVSLERLAGLHYYNQAVAEYNDKKLTSTIDLLEKASLFYNSSRITEFGLVLAEAISQDEKMPLSSKSQAINRVRNFINPQHTIAIR